MSIEHYAVLGQPVAHSLSPYIHYQYAKAFNLTIDYRSYEVSEVNFSAFLDSHLQLLQGCNIKYPLKTAAYQAAKYVSASATQVDAASALKIINHDIYAENYDAKALMLALTKIHRLELSSLKILVVGAGSLAKGFLPLLIASQPLQIDITNRTVAHAKALAAINNNINVYSFSELTKLSQQYDLIVNVSAASTHQQNIPIPLALTHQKTICYDVEYQNNGTIFQQWAHQHHLIAYNGLAMLFAHNACVFEWWFHKLPDYMTAYQVYITARFQNAAVDK